MRRILGISLAAVGFVAVALVLQHPWAEPADALKAKRADCFGFNVTESDDQAHVNVYNKGNNDIDVTVTFHQPSGATTGSPGNATVSPGEVANFTATGGKDDIQRARVEVNGGGQANVDAAVWRSMFNDQMTERQVTCDKA